MFSSVIRVAIKNVIFEEKAYLSIQLSFALALLELIESLNFFGVPKEDL